MKKTSAFLLSDKKIYRFAFYLCIIMLTLFLILRIAIIYSYVPEITGVDNNFVNTVSRMLAGLSPYPNPEAFPYYGNIYSPLYFIVCYFFGKIANVNPDYPIQVYQLCRTIALACDTLSVYLLYILLIKKAVITKSVALVITAFFSSVLCYLAYTFSRVDCLFLTLYISVFYFLIRNKHQNHSIYIWLLGFLCTACIFTKQNGCILPFLVLTWFFFSNQKKKILLFILTFFIFFSIFYLIFTKWIGYTYLSSYTITGLHNRIDFQWFYVYIFKPLANSILILPLSVGMVISIGLILLSKKPSSKAFGVVYIIQLLFSTCAAFKWGSSLGYYNENFFLAMILIAQYSRVEKLHKSIQMNIFWLTVPLLIIFFFHVLIQDYLFFVSDQKEKKKEYIHQQAVKKYIIDNLNGKHVLDLYNPNRDFFKNLLYKDLAVPQFDTINCCLLPDNTFDYTQLKTELLSGEIKFIIYPKDKHKQSIWGVSLANYTKDTSLYNYDIYRYTPIAPQ